MALARAVDLPRGVGDRDGLGPRRSWSLPMVWSCSVSEALGCPRRLWPVAFGLVNVVATGGTFCAIVIGTG